MRKHCWGKKKKKMLHDQVQHRLSENRSESRRADQSQNVDPVRGYKTRLGCFSRGLFLARSKEGKHIRGMKQQTHLHPPERKSPPFGIHELYSYPQTLRPSPCTHKNRDMFFEDACSSAAAAELQSGSQSWVPGVGSDTFAYILTGAL